MQEIQETWVQSLGWEDPLEKEMATHSSILAWEILWTEEPGGLLSSGWQKSWTWLSDWASMHDVFKIHWFPMCLLTPPGEYNVLRAKHVEKPVASSDPPGLKSLVSISTSLCRWCVSSCRMSPLIAVLSSAQSLSDCATSSPENALRLLDIYFLCCMWIKVSIPSLNYTHGMGDFISFHFWFLQAMLKEI